MRILAVVLILIVPAMALTGDVRVVDGDTIALGDQRIRLLDMDAPEAPQTCRDRAGLVWRCGEAATAAMAEMVTGRTLSCDVDRLDRWGRQLATCRADGLDIGGELVRAGLAVRYRDEPRYAAEESRSPRRPAWPVGWRVHRALSVATW